MEALYPPQAAIDLWPSVLGGGGLAAKLTFLRVSRALPAKQNCGVNGTGSNSALGCIMEFNRWNVAAGGGDEKRGGKGRAG